MISNDRDIVELLPDIIYEADLNLNLTYVNSVAFEKFGYSQEDLNMGLNIVQLIEPEYKKRAFSKIKLIFEGKETDPDEYLLRKKDGSTFYARVHSRPIFKNGQIIGLRGTINDINEMILAEQELKESEEKFRTIAEQSFMGIIIIQDGLFKYFNEQARKKQMGEKDVIQHHKYRIITKTGDVRWIENFSKTINYKGKPADLVMSFDITDKIDADQRLKESEEKYRLITENSQDIVYTLDLNLDNTYVSPSVYNVLGYDVDEAILMHPRDNTNKDDLEKIGRIYKEEFKLERKKDIEKDLNRKRVFTVREKHKDGRILTMEHTISWLRDENGIALGFLGVARDITEKTDTGKLLKESEEKYRKLFENSPIALMDQDFSEMKKHLDNLKASGINDFEKYFDDTPEEILKFMGKVKVIDVNKKTLEIYKANSKELNIAKEDLTFLINFCVKELKGLTTLRNQSILFDPNNKFEANFDKERIYEVISNLLLNAVKYTPPGGTISIQVQIEDDSYIISIKDNGIGFTEEEKSQAFKQFGKIERYGQGWDVAIEGTGLGLYITKKLVELHNGTIWLESEGRNKGSTFSFSIPKI